MPFNPNPLFYVTVEIPTSKQVLMTYLDNKTKWAANSIRTDCHIYNFSLFFRTKQRVITS